MEQWRVDSARSFFDSAEERFRDSGLDTAAGNLAYFRSGRGGTKFFSDEEIARHEPILDAEYKNRTRFATKTIVGKTKNTKLNIRLRHIRDGETIRFSDNWEAKLHGKYLPSQILGALRHPDTSYAFGRAEVQSVGDITARRQGKRIYINGRVQNQFDPRNGDNRYDFNKGQVGHRSAEALEAVGEAKPMDMQFRRD